MLKNKSYVGFTLAEVLITLGIIGVVAAMTIPTLMNKTNEKELRVAWKKSYSSISQIVQLVLNENGGNFKNMFDSGSNVNYAASENFKDTFKAHFSYVKDCKGTSTYGGTGSGASSEGCWHKENEWKYLYGANRENVDNPGLVLKDGTLLRFGLDSSNCSTPHTGATLTRCAFIQVDVNGFKKPNIQGKDIFAADIAENFIYPEGSKDWFLPETTCIEGGTANTNTGHGCAAKYLYE